MRLLIILVFLSLNLYSASLKDLWGWYNNKEYNKVCSTQISQNEYFKYNKDEDFINMYAYSCLQTDMINRLARPIMQLRKTKKSRANALYYTTVLYQKKILHHAIVDGFNELPTNLPNTQYILSKIYNLFAKKDYIKDKNTYIFELNNQEYRLFPKKYSDGYTKLVLQSVKNGIITKTRLYW